MPVTGSVRLAVRRLVRTPLVSLVVGLFSALGVASVLSVFGPLYSVIISPLPLPSADRLVRLGGEIPVFNVYTHSVLEPDALRGVFSQVAAYAPTTEAANEWQLDSGARIQTVVGAAVTNEFFDALGVAPLRGTTKLPLATNPSAVAISERLWRTSFGGDDSAIGKDVVVGGHRYVVSAVMPNDVAVPTVAEAWLPMSTAPYFMSGLEVIGRLRPGVDIASASQALCA